MQVLVERQVDVDLLVARAVEGAHRRLSLRRQHADDAELRITQSHALAQRVVAAKEFGLELGGRARDAAFLRDPDGNNIEAMTYLECPDTASE